MGGREFMKTYEQRKYSTDFIEQSLAIEKFSNDLKSRLATLINEKIGYCKRFIANNGDYWSLRRLRYYDEQMKEYPNRINEIKEQKQKVLEYVSTKKRASEEQLVKLELLLANPDVISSVVEETVGLIIDTKNKKIPGKLTEKGLESTRVMHGFIPNENKIIKNGSSYSGSINKLVEALCEEAMERAVEASKEQINDIETITEEEFTNIQEELLMLELEKKNLTEQISDLDKQIEHLKQKRALFVIKKDKSKVLKKEI